MMIDSLDSLATLPMLLDAAETAPPSESSAIFGRLLDQAGELNSKPGEHLTGGTELPQAADTGKVQPVLPWVSGQHDAPVMESGLNSFKEVHPNLHTGSDSTSVYSTDNTTDKNTDNNTVNHTDTHTANNTDPRAAAVGPSATPLLNTARSLAPHEVGETQPNPAALEQQHTVLDDQLSGQMNIGQIPISEAGMTRTGSPAGMLGDSPKQTGETVSPTSQPETSAKPPLSSPPQGQDIDFGIGLASGDTGRDLTRQTSPQLAGSVQESAQASLQSPIAQSEIVSLAGTAQPMQRDAVARLNILRNIGTADPIGSAIQAESARPSFSAAGIGVEHRTPVTSTPPSSFMLTLDAPIASVDATDRDRIPGALMLKSPGAISLHPASPDAPGAEVRSPLNPEVAGAGLGVLKASEQGQSIPLDRFSTQMAERIQVMHTRQLSSASIRLDPVDLGRIDVQIRVHQDVAHVNFQVQNAGVRDFMEQHMPRLRMAIEHSGLMLGDVDVGSRQHQQQAVPQETRHYTSQQGQDTPQIQNLVSSRSDWRLVDAYA